MFNNLGVDWASSTLAFISIAFIPIPFVLYKVSRITPGINWKSTLTLVILQYGATLRNNHSKYARKDI